MKCRKCPLLVVVCGFLFLGIGHGSKDLLKVTHTVTLEVKMGHQSTGRIEIGLFGKTVPKTVQNFIQLAMRPRGEGYLGTIFHRIVQGQVIQGGRIGDGSKAISYYGGLFPDENFNIKHYGAGWVAMASAGRDTNACQFYITTNSTADFIEGENVVFGKVLKGMDVVREIEASGNTGSDVPQIVRSLVKVVPVPFLEYKGDAYL